MSIEAWIRVFEAMDFQNDFISYDTLHAHFHCWTDQYDLCYSNCDICIGNRSVVCSK